MLIDTSPVVIPCLKVIEDVLLRSGPPTKYSATPYHGMAKEVLDYYYPGELPIAFLEVLRGQTDYDAVKQRPVAGDYEKGGSKDGNFLTRLEDIDSSWVRKYVENVIYGMNRNQSNSLRSYNSEHLRTYSPFKDNEGEYINPAELLVEDSKYSSLSLQKWIVKLPYLVKRLFEYGKRERMHVLSYVIAYDKLAKQMGAKAIRPRHMLEEGIYYADDFGDIKSRIPDNKNRVHEFWLPWIFGEMPNNPYYQDAMELIQICDQLGLPIGDAKPMEFNSALVKGLTVTYIVKNRDFASGYCAGQPVKSALKMLSVKDYNRSVVMEKREPSEWDLMVERMSRFNALHDRDIKLNRDRDKDMQTCLLMYRAALSKIHSTIRVPDISKLRIKDGFYMINNAQPLILDVSLFCVDKVRIVSKAMLHSSGYFVRHSSLDKIEYLSVDEAKEFLSDFIRGANLTDIRYGSKKFGTWEVVYQ